MNTPNTNECASGEGRRRHGIRCHDCGVPIETEFTVHELDQLNLEMLSNYKLAEKKVRQVRGRSKAIKCDATRASLCNLADAITALVRATLLHRDVYHPLPADDVDTLRSPAGWYAG